MADDPNVDPNAEPAGDPAATGESAERNAGADENQGKLIASLQEKAARVNEAERKAKELEAENERLRRAQSPAAPPRNVDPAAKQFRETVAWANGERGDGHPDEIAAVVVRNATDNAILAERLAERDALDDIPAEERKAVRKELDKLKLEGLGGAGAVELALTAVKAARADELEAENARLQEAFRNADRPTGAAPQTHAREVPASQVKVRTFDSLDQYHEQVAGMSSFDRLKIEEDIAAGRARVK